MAKYSSVNTAHPQQDVHLVRKERPTLARYTVAERLLPASTGGLSLLEVGCGRAEFARRLRDLGHTVTVTDLSPTNIESARELGFDAHAVDLNNGLTVFPDSHFSGLIMLEVIEHIVSAELLLDEVARVLRPGGFLILSTPNFVFLLNRLRILAGNLSGDEGYHYRFFTVKSLTRQLRKAGLVAEDWRFIMPAFGVNRIRRLIGIERRKHVLVPKWTATVLGQTMVVRARKRS